MADSLFDKKKDVKEKSLFDTPKQPEKTGIFSKPDGTAKPVAPKASEPAAVSGGAKAPVAKKKPVKKIIAIIAAALVGAGLVTAGVVFAVWYNSPETVFRQSLSKLVNTSDLKVNGSFSFPTWSSSDSKYTTSTAKFDIAVLEKGDDAKLSFGLDYKYKHRKYTSSRYEYTCGSKKYDSFSDAYKDCKSNYKSKYTPGKYEDTTDTYKLSADAVKVGDNYYAKVNLNDIKVGGEELPKEVKEYSNKWYHVSREFLDKKLEDSSDKAKDISKCTEGVLKGSRQSLSQDILDITTSGDSALLKAEAGDSNGGEVDYKITISTNVDRYVNSIKKLYKLELVKKLLACDDGYRDKVDEAYNGLIESYDKLSDTDKEQSSDSLKRYLPRITLTINKSSREITKITVKSNSKTSSSSKFSVTLNLKYDTQKDDSIKAPSKYTTIDDKFLKDKGVDTKDISLPKSLSI
ncbi:MAG: hypothetical protein LBG75_01160 [Candidatus Nomurabacteria bacterium]|jgi:hypothetical protein|nr:hypothetical protein [Candidatus Nomurabacteria bacterium]